MQQPRNTQNNIYRITKDDLSSCRWKAAQTKSAKERLDEWRMRMEYTAYYPTRAKSSNKGQRKGIDDALCGMERILALYRQMVKDNAAAVLLVENTIAQLPPKESEILRMRYIDNLKWSDISKRLHYEESWCRRLHKQALEMLGI